MDLLSPREHLLQSAGLPTSPYHLGVLTPRTPRVFSKAHDSDDDEEINLRLLPPEHAQDGDDDFLAVEKRKASVALSGKDRFAVGLLITLYLFQGIPIGLAFGSIPFILRHHISYSQIGLFSLCTYPFSLKLVWSPLIDTIYKSSWGRRKSWIVPLQLGIGLLLFWVGTNAQQWIESPDINVLKLTVIFTAIMAFTATQGIAVDGWALTLLSQENLSYASTAQTIGTNSGYFISFTAFLALNSANFANRYIRHVPSDEPLLSLQTYLCSWGALFMIFSVWLTLFVHEDESADTSELKLGTVYSIMWRICKLSHIQSICIIHFISKLGFQGNEAVTNLKLIEKGLKEEELALAILIDFPFQLAASWATGILCKSGFKGFKGFKLPFLKRPVELSSSSRTFGEPNGASTSAAASANGGGAAPGGGMLVASFTSWIYAFWARLAFGLLAMYIVSVFPNVSPVSGSFFMAIVASTILTSFSTTVQFVAMASVHTYISDPVIGGTYMTLMNTISNLGGIWPRYFVLRGVDMFTVANCHTSGNATLPLAVGNVLSSTFECVSDTGKQLCIERGGQCIIQQDGYYYVSAICTTLGVLSLVTYIWPTVKRVQALPLSKWRVSIS